MSCGLHSTCKLSKKYPACKDGAQRCLVVLVREKECGLLFPGTITSHHSFESETKALAACCAFEEDLLSCASASQECAADMVYLEHAS